MADRTTNLEVVFRTKGLDKLRGLSSELSRMSKGAKGAGLSVKGLITEMRQKERTEVKSINNTRALSNGYRELARQVDVSSREFREATREANRLETFEPYERLGTFGSGIAQLISGYPGRQTFTSVPNPTPLQTALGVGSTLSGIYGNIMGPVRIR